MDADVIVVGAGLAGLVATAELADAGRRVILLDQEPEASFGGQAFWSLGGLMFVDSPEQRRMRVKDSYELALQDWLGTAGFDRPEDEWPRRWAEAYVGFCAGEKRAWLHEQGMRWLPNPGWPERGGYLADGHGNSVPRFHITWGTGPGVVEPFERRVREAVARGLVELRFRHRVDELHDHRRRRHRRVGHGPRAERRQARRGQRPRAGGRVRALRPGRDRHHRRHRRQPRAGAREVAAAARRRRPRTCSPACPRTSTAGCSRSPATPARTRSTATACGTTSRASATGTRSGPCTRSGSSPGRRRCGSTRTARRLPGPLYPGFDTLGTLRHIQGTGRDHTWFVLTQKIIEKEFALSGSEQNPDTTSKSKRAVLKERLGSGPPSPVQAFMDHGEDFIVERSLPQLVRRMNALIGEDLIDHGALEAQIVARDRQLANPYAKDGQITAIHAARAYTADKVTRVAAPHRILDPKAGPLIAVRLSILTRKSLGGLQTDLSSRVLQRVRRAARRPLRGRRGGRLRRRRRARLPRSGGDVPRRLPVLRADRRAAPRRPPPLSRAHPNIRRMGS